MAFKMKGPSFFGKSIRASKHGPKPMNPKSPLTKEGKPGWMLTTDKGDDPTGDDVKPPKDKNIGKKGLYKSDKSWKEGVDASKKSGGNLNEWVKQRKGLEKGSDAWKKVQNKINESLGNKKRYEVTAKTGVASDVVSQEGDTGKTTRARKMVGKADIKAQKMRGKLEAKGAGSEGGAKITPAERARIKEQKLKSKVEIDKAQGKKGLFAGIRKRRAARKARKNIKKGYTKAAETNGDATTTTATTKTNGNGNGKSKKAKRKDKITTAQRIAAINSSVATTTEESRHA